jgi:hypothetical protein
MKRNKNNNAEGGIRQHSSAFFGPIPDLVSSMTMSSYAENLYLIISLFRPPGKELRLS